MGDKGLKHYHLKNNNKFKNQTPWSGFVPAMPLHSGSKDLGLVITFLPAHQIGGVGGRGVRGV